MKLIRCRMIEEIVCFVVRNKPLRVARVSRITSDSTEMPVPPIALAGGQDNPQIVTLNSIISEYPDLTEARLRRTPDNQLLAFWSEAAFFNTVGPVKSDNVFYTDHNFFNFHIYATSDGGDRGARCGQTELCSPRDDDDPICQAGEGRFEFVLLATCEVLENDPAEASSSKDNRMKTDLPPIRRSEKIVMQISRNGGDKGVASRVSTARIREEAWNAANPQRKLVVLE